MDWSDLGVTELLPTGTVTLLLADVEGSTRLWQTQPGEMTAAVARLDRVLAEAVTNHGGVRPVEQGEGDSFVIGFARASDAVACALDLQRAPLAPIRLRIGVHTGEVQLRDEGNYIGPTINRTARLRDLAHGRQTVLSGATAELIAEYLPTDAWVTDLGAHPLRDLPRPQRVVQLCHPDLCNEFPPLRTPDAAGVPNLPVQLTSFVGRATQIGDVQRILADNRLVTLTGAGGVGKTRLATQIAAKMASQFGHGLWYVDLAPISDPDIVPTTVARALGRPDHPGRSTMDTLLGFVGDRRTLMLLDNCEHLLDACAALTTGLLSGCPRLTLLTTSREPIGVPGEVTWRVPSLSLDTEAIELFTDRARRALPDFRISDDNRGTVEEICRRLDGMPLAIELAAARVRALSLDEILESLHDRFRLLTGSARSSVQRHQTLRACVDWSHALLTETEQILFRRLGAFVGGFDVDAARAVAGGVERYQILDQLSLLVDKSLVVAENPSGRTRYRLLETVRQYAHEKLVESDEATDVRTRHRDHYTAIAAALDSGAQGFHEQHLEQAETEIDNLRAAFAWSRENRDRAVALTLASSLLPLWLGRGRMRDGLTWFNSVLEEDANDHTGVSAEVQARALAGIAVLDVRMGGMGASDGIERAQRALAIAREIADPALLVRTLTACGSVTGGDAAAARPYFAEAIGLARALGDQWSLSEILYWQAAGACIAGDSTGCRAAAEEGCEVADAIGNRFVSLESRMWVGLAQLMQGNLDDAISRFRELTTAPDTYMAPKVIALGSLGQALAYRGDTAGARAAADAAIHAAAEFGGMYLGSSYAALAYAALAAGDVTVARNASETAWPKVSVQPNMAAVFGPLMAQVALAQGDVITAHCFVDDAVNTATGSWRMLALTTRARVAMAQGEPARAREDAHAALACGAEVQAYLHMPNAIECLAALAAESGSHHEAARLFGAAQAMRQRTGEARFRVYQDGYEATVATLRNSMGKQDFESVWAEGAELSTDEAIAYAQRGRGERRRATTGWGSLTPTELEVVRHVQEGLSNKDIVQRFSYHHGPCRPTSPTSTPSSA